MRATYPQHTLLKQDARDLRLDSELLPNCELTQVGSLTMFFQVIAATSHLKKRELTRALCQEVRQLFALARMPRDFLRS